MAPAWSVAHTGYDTTIYTADGIRYSDAISVTIESAMLDGDTLSVKFSAAESPDIEGVDAADIVPSVLVACTAGTRRTSCRRARAAVR